MSLKAIIRREILARHQTMVGTVVSDQSLIEFDASASGSESWVVDVDIGSNRIIRDVVIKAGTRGRFFAQRGQTVSLHRNSLGRFDIVGPADKLTGVANLNTYDINANTLTASSLTGFVTVFRPYEYYQGAIHMTGAVTVTFAAGANTITRTVGSWLTDGFIAGGGQTIRIAGSTSNNATRTTSSATALVLTVTAGIVNEGPTVAGAVSIAVNGGGRYNDGVTGYPVTQIINQATGLPV